MKANHRLLCKFLIVVFIISSSGCASYRVHPEFKERHKNIRSVAVMPPDIEVYKLTFKGDKEPMYEVIAVATKQSKDEIEKIFNDKGYQVQELNLSEEKLKDEPDLRSALFNIRELYKKTLGDIAKRKQKKFTYSLGSDINQFADLANSDILVMMKAEGFKKTGGEIAKDIIKSTLIFAATLGSVFVHYTPSAAVIYLAVIDGNTGDILWFNNNQANPNIDMAKEKHIRVTLKRLLKAFPDSAYKLKN
jgi:hypothetical protein